MTTNLTRIDVDTYSATPSVIHPGCEGRDRDLGKIAGVEVVGSELRESKDVYWLARPVADGTYLMEVNWLVRYDTMQQDTARHLLSQLLWRAFGVRTVGGSLVDGVFEVDSGDLPSGYIRDIEDAANQAIREAGTISVVGLGTEAAIVEVDGLGGEPCQGNHVRRLSELQAVLLAGRPGGRIEYVTGARVLEVLRRRGPDGFAIV